MNETLIVQPIQQQPVYAPPDVVQTTMEERRLEELAERRDFAVLEEEGVLSPVETHMSQTIFNEATYINQHSRTMSKSEKKKRQQLVDQRKKVQRGTVNIATAREQVVVREQQGGGVMTSKEIERETALLTERLKEISLELDVKLMEANERNLSAEEVLLIKLNAQQKRSMAKGSYARMLPLGTIERRNAMAEKEKAELEAFSAKRLYKISQIVNVKEREREMKTFKRHQKFDALKKIFRKNNPASREDAVVEIGNRKLVNVGRATFGGTKPMYIFEDRNDPILHQGQPTGKFKRYLYKEAVNCIGMEKTEGAVVTECASELQQQLCGQFSIPAFAHREGNRVLGSFQEFVESQHDAPNLFKWQANPVEYEQNEDTKLTDQIKTDILREHTLDWLLCNFDTKGENFLFRRTDERLCSFDKEASFSKLKDPDAREMSSTYKPHSNETIYNIMFREFEEGRLDLNLQDVLPQIERMENMDNNNYLATFAPMLNQKYGTGNSPAKTAAQAAILERKTSLRETYRAFFTKLYEKRGGDFPKTQDGMFRFDKEPAPT